MANATIKKPSLNGLKARVAATTFSTLKDLAGLNGDGLSSLQPGELGALQQHLEKLVLLERAANVLDAITAEEKRD